jgi:hypothetical protein
MKQHLLGLAGTLALAATAATAQAQTGVGIGTSAPDVSAALDIVSSKGALLPRVADATAIATPATGLLVPIARRRRSGWPKPAPPGAGFFVSEAHSRMFAP